MGLGSHVQTDMGDQGARLMGRSKAPTTIEESITGICARVCSYFLCLVGKGKTLADVPGLSCATD